MLKTILHGVKVAASMAAAVLFFATLAWAANNYPVVGGGGAIFTMKSTETSNIHLPHFNLDSVGGTALGAASAYGTSPGAVNVPGVNAYVTNLAADPCAGSVWTRVAINQTTSTRLVTATAAVKIYVCHMFLIAQAAEIVSLVEGTGSVCGTSAGAVVGPTTVGQGISLAANGGFQLQAGGRSVGETINANVDLCLNQDGSDRITGVLSYVKGWLMFMVFGIRRRRRTVEAQA
jgi:hypothetical protein